MKYDALTIDTNLFKEKGYRLEEDHLSQLNQFKNGPVDLIISEVVLREMSSHMLNNAKEAHDSLKRAFKKGSDLFLVSDGLDGFHDNLLEPKEVVDRRIRRFIQNTGAKIIPQKLASIDELLKMYFSPLPPFMPTGNKKNEFPDAIALISIDAWAKENGKKVLAISSDAGWSDYAKKNGNIEVINDFATGLQLLQEDVERATTIFRDVLRKLQNGDLVEVDTEINDLISQSVSAMNIYVNADSSMEVEADFAEVELQSFEFSDEPDDIDVKILYFDEETITAQVGVRLFTKVSADFSFSIYDSIDKESVPMGTNSETKDFEFESDVILTFHVEISDDVLEDVTATEADLVENSETVDFGYVEIDYGDYDEHFSSSWEEGDQ